MTNLQEAKNFIERMMIILHPELKGCHVKIEKLKTKQGQPYHRITLERDGKQVELNTEQNSSLLENTNAAYSIYGIKEYA